TTGTPVRLPSVIDPPRSARTPRPTRTPHKKITTDTTVAAMKRNTSCLPFSWISWKPSSAEWVAKRSDFNTLPAVYTVDEAPGLCRARIECERPFGLRPCRMNIFDLQVRFPEREVGARCL